MNRAKNKQDKRF